MLFLFLLTVVHAAPNGVLISDYNAGPTQGEAWITLSSPSLEWDLDRLVWCKSLVPNDQNPAPLPHDCVGRNLLRMQLYPTPQGHGEAVVRETPPAPDGMTPVHLYHVDPERVGGWDSRHQWIMEMELRKTGTAEKLIQVVRFNALTPLTEGVTTTESATTSAAAQETTATSSSLGKQDESTTLEATTTSVIEVGNGWLGFGVILGVGFCFVAAVIAAYQLRKRRPLTNSLVAAQRALQHYPWNEPDDEDARLREEDLQVLSKVNN
jgi:hypothetical protein